MDARGMGPRLILFLLSLVYGEISASAPLFANNLSLIGPRVNIFFRLMALLSHSEQFITLHDNNLLSKQ